MKPLDPVLTVPLFPKERAALLDVLSSLDDAAWSRETSCPGWSLKDIAAHLLADDLGRLSGSRDDYRGWRFEPSGAGPFEVELLNFINGQNEAWVAAARRLSPRVIMGFLEWSGKETQEQFESLDPNGEAAIGVSWAGESRSANWFDLAREYTERWHHQAQIRESAGAPMLYEPELFAPLIDTFIRALPHTFRETAADDGAQVAVAVRPPSQGWGPEPRNEGALLAAPLRHAPAAPAAQGWAPEPRLRYSLVREAGRWGLYQPMDGAAPAASVTIDGDVAWRLFTKGIPKAEAISRSILEGDRRLAERVFDTVSIIA